MRVLFVDPNVLHINPTANLLPALLLEISLDTMFYGPGYVDDVTIEIGLLAYIEKHGPFDAVIFGAGNSLFNKDLEEDRRVANSVCKNFTCSFRSSVLEQFYTDVRNHCGDLPVPIKVLSALNLDYYASTEVQVDFILQNSLLVLGPNEQFVQDLNDLPSYARLEKHYIRKVDRLSNAWRDFLVKNPERVLTALHFIGPSELCFKPLNARSYDVSVPGVEYFLRREATRQINKSRYQRPSKRVPEFFRIASRMGFPIFSNPILAKMYNTMFQEGLFDTRAVYTARGGFGIPIRKFFEIPASGALMVCEPPVGFKDLGFNNQEHFVEAGPHQLLDVLSEWLGSERAQTVARQGQRVVLNKHSLSPRAAQIGECLYAVHSGRYLGSRWTNGEFVVQLKEKETCVV